MSDAMAGQPMADINFDELGEAVMLIVLHQMPKDWLFTDLGQSLRFGLAVLAHTAPEPTRQNRDFHLPHHCLL